MRLEAEFVATGLCDLVLRAPDLPMEIELDPYGRYRVQQEPGSEPLRMDQSHREVRLLIHGEREVDPAHLELVPDHFAHTPDPDAGPGRALRAPEVYELAQGAVRISSAISFAMGVAMHVRPELGPGNLVRAETPAEQQRLDELGAWRVRAPLTLASGIEVFDEMDVDAALIEKLARRGAVCVYAEALRVKTPVACFRELWRTLELSFQAHGRQLVELVAAFPPALELGFDEEELEELRTLRNQLSHAASRLGAADVAQFERKAAEALGRLWSLVDRVLLTKRDASRSLAVDELSPLAAFIRRDGAVQLMAEQEDPDTWIAVFAMGTPRFS